jgi:hypothetical protein
VAYRCIRYTAAISERDGRPDECTIFPEPVESRDGRRSAWITARGDAYVGLHTME